MDLASKIIIILSSLLCLVMAAIFFQLGINDVSLLLNTFLLIAGGYLLFVANTPLRANRYRELKTRWSDEAQHKEYPRPQLQRENWLNLNGVWDYALRPKDAPAPTVFDGKINVPFPLESNLSGVAKKIRPQQKLWYHTTFNKPLAFQRLRLHFGAVDWECEVWINDQWLGKHSGGHDAFYFDIEKYLTTEAQQKLCVSVWDPCDAGVQPRGKQSRRPSNIYYKAVTGIWQTVWLEPLPDTAIETLNYVANIDDRTLALEISCSAWQSDDEIKVQVFDGAQEIANIISTEKHFQLSLPATTQCWSPDNPKLYPTVISIIRQKKIIDSINTYFALREIKIKPDQQGINRVYLNKQAIFQLGLLDQGWWPDGLYTAPNDEALKYDIEISKAMGFNMIRKHVKVEPARWYFHCDTIGMLVWQDMPTGDKNILPRQKDLKRSEASKKIFHQELDAMLAQLRCFPSIVCWVPFNEGWGQFDTNNVLQKVKRIDPSRLVDGPSGWNDRSYGDFRDYHIYMRKLFIGKQKTGRAEAIGEFGGIGHRIKSHMAVTNSWSYNNVKNLELLKQKYRTLYEQQLLPLIEQGLCAVVYTQTTDVESEINGLLTYDREIEKIPVQDLQEIHQQVYQRFNLTIK